MISLKPPHGEEEVRPEASLSSRFLHLEIPASSHVSKHPSSWPKGDFLSSQEPAVSPFSLPLGDSDITSC